jgi:hypothetical protein
MPDYTMKVTGLDVQPSLDGKTNVVHRANWTLSATDGVKTFTYPGKTSIPYNPNGEWLEYGSLDEDVVLGWISRLSAGEILAVRASLALNFNATADVRTEPLPW